jgi:tRNA pseudouridine55 synthase
MQQAQQEFPEDAPTFQFSGIENLRAGVILIDKPEGPTSAAMVGKVRGALRRAKLFGKHDKIGHGGTLDPMATGLLVLLLGRATRLADSSLHIDKTYSGTIQLGFSTDTDDVTGERISEIAPAPELSDALLDELSRALTGTFNQLPPQYSALKVDGQRAYDIARSGEHVALETRSVTISLCSLRRGASPAQLEFKVSCSGGTYIRSIARDIGIRLGCGATLSSLRRERSGPFSIEQAGPLLVGGKVNVLPWWELLPGVARVSVTEDISAQLERGDQRVLSRVDFAALSLKLGEKVIYTVEEVPHGVLRVTASGLELLVHVGR